MHCKNCKREITPALSSPDSETCMECFIYYQDIAADDARNIVTREMAMDAGMPEIEGMEF